MHLIVFTREPLTKASGAYRPGFLTLIDRDRGERFAICRMEEFRVRGQPDQLRRLRRAMVPCTRGRLPESSLHASHEVEQSLLDEDGRHQSFLGDSRGEGLTVRLISQAYQARDLDHTVTGVNRRHEPLWASTGLNRDELHVQRVRRDLHPRGGVERL
jgi:hypothetical protein